MCSLHLGGRLPSRLTQKAAGPSTWRTRVRGPMKPEGAASWTGGPRGRPSRMQGSHVLGGQSRDRRDSREPPRDEDEEEEIEIAGAGARRSVKRITSRKTVDRRRVVAFFADQMHAGASLRPSSSAYPEVKLRPLRFLRFSQICSFLLEKVGMVTHAT